MTFSNSEQDAAWLSEELNRSERWRILRNVSVITLALMVQFTAFQGTANLQPLINAEDGVGTVSLSAIYATLIISCIFLPTLIIRKLTIKWTLVFSMLCYTPYIAFQSFPKFYTLIPAGILIGIGAAPSWASISSYLTKAGQVYAMIVEQPADAIIVRFYGIFFLVFQTAELWGNLISSLVISDNTDDSTYNDSIDDNQQICDPNLERPPDREIFILTLIYLLCLITGAVIIAVFLDPQKRYNDKYKGAHPLDPPHETEGLTGMRLLWATFRQMQKPNQQLLIPITFFIGMEQAYIGGDYIVSCALGIHEIGYLMICFGVVSAICSILFGSVMKYIGRTPIIVLGAVVHFTLILFKLFWHPSSDHQLIVFATYGLWGIGDAVWHTQINGLYSTLFRNNIEPAFSNYRLWETAGLAVAYAIDIILSARLKLCILLIILMMGCLGYFVVENLHKKKQEVSSVREALFQNLSEKWRIIKNVVVISFAFMVQFTAFQGIANLQSSINAEDGLGTISLSAIYAALVVSCMFLPTLVIQKFTVKRTICYSMLCYLPYIAFQLFPRFYTLVVAGVLVGLGAAPMWASVATYLTQVGHIYGTIVGQHVDAIIVRFFGFFFLAWQTAELWGNLISSLVISGKVHGSSNDITIDDELQYCGANFCASKDNGHHNLERPPHHEVLRMIMIYLTCIISAVSMIALLLDPLHYYQKHLRFSRPSLELNTMKLLAATFQQMKKLKQLLLIPITIFIGMEQAFIGADFTEAYISCAWGIHQIGYVMICFGVVNALCSIAFGSLMKYIGRIRIIVLGAVVHFALITFKLFWRPSPDKPLIFFVISGLWGVGDAVWQTQINGLYGSLFKHNAEAAFSNYRLWESAGFVVAYAYDTTLCARTKLYNLLAVLTLGCIGYAIIEIKHKIKKRKNKEHKAKEDEIKKQKAEEAATAPVELENADEKGTTPEIVNE